MRGGRFSFLYAPLFVLGLFFLAIVLQSCLLNTVNTFSADSDCKDEIEDIHQLKATLSPHGCFTSACHFKWADYSEDDFVTEGLIARTSSGSSLLYTKLAGAGGGGDMPLGFFPDVSAGCLLKISNYINSL